MASSLKEILIFLAKKDRREVVEDPNTLYFRQILNFASLMFQDGRAVKLYIIKVCFILSGFC
jgi:hypothetical protein